MYSANYQIIDNLWNMNWINKFIWREEKYFIAPELLSIEFYFLWSDIKTYF